MAPITEPNINPPADIKAVTSAIGKKNHSLFIILVLVLSLSHKI